MVDERTEEQKRKGYRKNALDNLKDDSFVSLAVAHLAEKGDFGEAGKSAIEMYKYFPALNSEDGKKLQNSLLLNSRQDGQRYTGRFFEADLIKYAAEDMQKSLLSIKVSDVLGLIGSDQLLKGNYRGKYVSELNEKDKQIVIGSYQAYIATKYVSEALGESVNGIKGGLEEIICEPQNSINEDLKRPQEYRTAS